MEYDVEMAQRKSQMAVVNSMGSGHDAVGADPVGISTASYEVMGLSEVEVEALVVVTVPVSRVKVAVHAVVTVVFSSMEIIHFVPEV